jgi:hypothetical protein
MQDSLQWLDSPFSKQEIDSIIAALPLDKSPSPDGFNTNFIKKCWHIISQDFYDLCEQFYHEDVCLRSINGSFIVLVPKKENPQSVGDFRPISFLNNSMKIITKLLANRLQTVMTSLVHKNQYGFIKGRTIQDCLACAYEYIHLCHISKKKKSLCSSWTLKRPLIPLNMNLSFRCCLIEDLDLNGSTGFEISFSLARHRSYLMASHGKLFIASVGSGKGTLSRLYCLFWRQICFRVLSTKQDNKIYSSYP